MTLKLFDMPDEPGTTQMAWPTREVLWPGALQQLPAQVERLKMQRPLVVTDGGVVKAGLAGRLYEVLKAAKVAFEVFDKVEPNPTEKDAFDGVAFYKEKKCDGLIGIGGCSPLDAMKLIQLLTTHDPPLSKYDD